MSKEANLKNQNKLKVYLAKTIKNDTKSSNNGNKNDRGKTRTN